MTASEVNSRYLTSSFSSSTPVQCDFTKFLFVMYECYDFRREGRWTLRRRDRSWHRWTPGAAWSSRRRWRWSRRAQQLITRRPSGPWWPIIRWCFEIYSRFFNLFNLLPFRNDDVCDTSSCSALITNSAQSTPFHHVYQVSQSDLLRDCRGMYL